MYSCTGWLALCCLACRPRRLALLLLAAAMATAAATAEFVARAAMRLATPPPGPARKLGQLHVSPFGYGAYRMADGGAPAAAPKLYAESSGRRARLVRPEVAAQRVDGPGSGAALAAALESRLCNVIDTSVSYADGASERLVGDVLADAMTRGDVRREEMVLVTKVGHVSADAADTAPPDSLVISSPSGKKRYSIHPDWIAAEVAASTERLGTAPDVVLLHNPEFYLAEARSQSQLRAVAHDIFHQTTRKAFGAVSAVLSTQPRLQQA